MEPHVVLSISSTPAPLPPPPPRHLRGRAWGSAAWLGASLLRAPGAAAMTSQRKDASAEVLLCRDGVPPELLAAKLDALDPDARFALFDKKKNIAAVASKLAEARARARVSIARLCRSSAALRRAASRRHIAYATTTGVLACCRAAD